MSDGRNVIRIDAADVTWTTVTGGVSFALADWDVEKPADCLCWTDGPAIVFTDACPVHGKLLDGRP